MKLFASTLLVILGGLAPGLSIADDSPAPAVIEPASSKPSKPDIVKGEIVFNGKACAACHNADGNSAIPANPKGDADQIAGASSQ